MTEESTTPDLVELTRQAFETAGRHDVDALMAFYGHRPVFDLSDVGLGTLEGVAAIGRFFQDWWETWAEHRIEVEEILDLGHGVVFARVREDGRLVGSDSHVEQSRGWTFLWTQGMIERQAGFLDIDDARAAAERLAEPRG